MKSEREYIWIPNWFGRDGEPGFQHYKDRDPIWIKNYTRLLSHDAYCDLTFTQRGVLHGIWMEYAQSARSLPGDTLMLSRRLSQQVKRRDLEALSHAGFIELIASDVLAERLQPASTHALAREEVEKEKKDTRAVRTEEDPRANGQTTEQPSYLDIDFDNILKPMPAA